MRMNLPNQITLGRLVIAIVFLVLLVQCDLRQPDALRWRINLAFWLFIVAALSDILDGYLARKHNQVTSFGRIVDPFVDKTLICGGFILLLGDGFLAADGRNVAGLSGWMVVIIVARELLVSGLRGFSEAGGTPYAANNWGKAKMLAQSVALPLMLLTVGPFRERAWVIQTRDAVIWLMLGITIISVFAYLSASRAALAERARE